MSRPGPPADDDGDGDRSADAAGAAGSRWAWFVPIAAVVAVGAIYLGPWIREPDRLPVGFDTAGYVWRANAVWEVGLDALPTFRERPGHPVLAGVLRDVTRGTPIDLARTWPATIAVAIGSAAAALAWSAGARPAVVALATAIGVAGSGFVAATAVGYAANLLVDAFLVAGVAVALAARRGGGAVVLSILMIAATVTHWMLAVLLVGLVAIVIATSVVVRASEGDAVRRPPVHLAAALGVAVLLSGAALLLAPELPSHGVQQEFGAEVERRIERRMPPFGLQVTLPLAAAGTALIGVWGGREHRRSLPVLVAWAAAAPAGLLAWYALEVNVPPYRSVGVALGIPALIVLGAGGPAARTWSRRRWVLASVPVAAALAAAGWLATTGATTWWRTEPIVSREGLAQAIALDAYLATLPAGTTTVVPVGGNRVPPQLILKLGMRASSVAAVELRPADLSAGTDAFVDDALREDRDHTVVVLLAAYHRHEPDGGVELGPGVVLLHGPEPTGPLTVASSDTTSLELIRITVLSIGLLLLVGAGWTLAFAGGSAVVGVSLAPAVGAAILVVVGLVAARLGVGLAGGGGIAIAGVAGAIGWAAWVVGRLRARSPSVARA
jgi:hypothetical protein